MAELLLEVLSEEIPAGMQVRAADDLKNLICAGLKGMGVAYESASAFVTPRRLVTVVDGLVTATADISEERRGPNTNAPEKAVHGFLSSLNLILEDLEKRKTEKGEFYFALIETKGRKTSELLVDVVESAIVSLSWPKSMRWADYNVRWVRPILSIVCMFDSRVVPVNFGPIKAGNRTQGHRFLSRAVIEVNDFADYKKSLEIGHVLIDPIDRQASIKADAQVLALKESLVLVDDQALLSEVAGLVEWPVTLMGSIDDEFMVLPPEVLTTTMRKNQKYFALETKDGKLASHFIVVANKETPDDGAAIIAGNERVLRARLADAKFFWDKDQKKSLASRGAQLKNITFHAKLGSMVEKMERVELLAVKLADIIGAEKQMVRSAVRLAKSDLSTGMVNEFPNLQGVMGRYYALNDGEPIAVADAIAEHYSPEGPSDVCPTAPVSIVVSMADKIDTLVGFWAISEKPTGSKDPFALRRATLGVLRLLIENKLSLSLMAAFETSWEAGRYTGNCDEILKDLLIFFTERLKVYLKEKGIRHDLVSAVFALGNEDNVARLLSRVAALATFINSDDGMNLLMAYKRAANILRIEEKKDKVNYASAIDVGALNEPEEKELHVVLINVIDQISQNLGEEDYIKAMSGLSSLRVTVDAFFSQVTVNCENENLRVNRLRLLSQIRATMNQVADFSQIEGGER